MYNVNDIFKQNVDNINLKKLLANLNTNTDVAILFFPSKFKKKLKQILVI